MVKKRRKAFLSKEITAIVLSCVLFHFILFVSIAALASEVASEGPKDVSLGFSSFSFPEDSDRILKIKNESFSINAGKQLRLVTEITRIKEEAPRQSTLFWTSENEIIATVNQNGVVKALSPGTVRITCSIKDNPDICAFAVVNVRQPVKSIILSSNKIELLYGASASAAWNKISTTIVPDSSTVKECAFSSSNERVVTVDSQGNLQAVGPGNARITVESLEEGSTVKSYCNITVRQAVSSIKIPTYETVDKKKTVQLKPTVLPANASQKKVEFLSSDPSIATVSPNGAVTGIECGTVIITAKATDGSDIFAECKVKVVQLTQSIRFDKTSLNMTCGTTYVLQPIVLPENVTYPHLSWSSSQPYVVSVTNGKLTAVSNGNAVITCAASDGSGVKATVNVHVTYTTKTKNTLSNGTPLGGPYQMKYSVDNELKKGKVEVHHLSLQKLNNHYLRFELSYHAPAGYGISAFSPPNGQYYMVIAKRSTTAGEDTVYFEIYEDDFLASSSFTIKFYGRNDAFWIFPSVENKLKEYLRNPSSIPLPSSTPKPTVTTKPSSSGSYRSEYMSDSDLKELAVFYFVLYGGNKNSIILTDISCKGNEAVVLIAYGNRRTVGILMDRTTGEYKGMKKGQY